MSKTLKTVENNLVLSVVFSVIISIFVVFLFYFYTLNANKHALEKVANSKLNNVVDNYKYNFLSKVGVIASSTEVVDFLRSGKKTRKRLKANLLRVMARMPKDKEIAGWKFTGKNKQSLMEIGITTGLALELGLCYLSSGLSAKYGDCNASLIIYFDSNKLINKIKSFDSNVKECTSCSKIKLFSSDINMFFLIESDIGVNINYDVGYSFYEWPFLIVSICALIWVGFSSKRRISRILRGDIINPLTDVCRKYKDSDNTVYAESTVEEIIDIRMKYKLLQTQTFTAEKEKRKLANELHDALGSFIIKLRWEVAEILKRNRDNKSDLPLIRSALESVDYLLKATDDIIEFLRPEVVDTLGLKEAIRSLIIDFEGVQQFTVELSVYLNDTSLPDVSSHSAYRIVQEALTNIVKHSNASVVEISIEVLAYNHEECLQITIKDNGRGFDNNVYKNGHGLSSMRERSLSLGGHFDIISKLNRGTKIEVILPISFPAS